MDQRPEPSWWSMVNFVYATGVPCLWFQNFIIWLQILSTKSLELQAPQKAHEEGAKEGPKGQGHGEEIQGPKWEDPSVEGLSIDHFLNGFPCEKCKPFFSWVRAQFLGIERCPLWRANPTKKNFKNWTFADSDSHSDSQVFTSEARGFNHSNDDTSLPLPFKSHRWIWGT